jgi:hypothetical protein
MLFHILPVCLNSSKIARPLSVNTNPTSYRAVFIIKPNITPFSVLSAIKRATLAFILAGSFGCDPEAINRYQSREFRDIVIMSVLIDFDVVHLTQNLTFCRIQTSTVTRLSEKIEPFIIWSVFGSKVLLQKEQAMLSGKVVHHFLLGSS